MNRLRFRYHEPQGKASCADLCARGSGRVRNDVLPRMSVWQLRVRHPPRRFSLPSRNHYRLFVVVNLFGYEIIIYLTNTVPLDTLSDRPAPAGGKTAALSKGRLTTRSGFGVQLGRADGRNVLADAALSAQLQRLEDSCLRRMCRLINAFGKFRDGTRQKKMLIKMRSKPLCV